MIILVEQIWNCKKFSQNLNFLLNYHVIFQKLVFNLWKQKVPQGLSDKGGENGRISHKAGGWSRQNYGGRDTTGILPNIEVLQMPNCGYAIWRLYKTISPTLKPYYQKISKTTWKPCIEGTLGCEESIFTGKA